VGTYFLLARVVVDTFGLELGTVDAVSSSETEGTSVLRPTPSAGLFFSEVSFSLLEVLVELPTKPKLL